MLEWFSQQFPLIGKEHSTGDLSDARTAPPTKGHISHETLTPHIPPCANAVKHPLPRQTTSLPSKPSFKLPVKISFPSLLFMVSCVLSQPSPQLSYSVIEYSFSSSPHVGVGLGGYVSGAAHHSGLYYLLVVK